MKKYRLRMEVLQSNDQIELLPAERFFTDLSTRGINKPIPLPMIFNYFCPTIYHDMFNSHKNVNITWAVARNSFLLNDCGYHWIEMFVAHVSLQPMNANLINRFLCALFPVVVATMLSCQNQ